MVIPLALQTVACVLADGWFALQATELQLLPLIQVSIPFLGKCGRGLWEESHDPAVREDWQP